MRSGWLLADAMAVIPSPELLRGDETNSILLMTAVAIFGILTLIVTISACACCEKPKKKGNEANGNKADTSGDDAKEKKTETESKKGAKSEEKKEEKAKSAEEKSVLKETSTRKTQKGDGVKSLQPKSMLTSARKSTKPGPLKPEAEAPAWDIPAFTIVDDKETYDTILDMAGKHDFQPTIYMAKATAKTQRAANAKAATSVAPPLKSVRPNAGVGEDIKSQIKEAAKTQRLGKATAKEVVKTRRLDIKSAIDTKGEDELLKSVQPSAVGGSTEPEGKGTMLSSRQTAAGAGSMRPTQSIHPVETARPALETARPALQSARPSVRSVRKDQKKVIESMMT